MLIESGGGHVRHGYDGRGYVHVDGYGLLLKKLSRCRARSLRNTGVLERLDSQNRPTTGIARKCIKNLEGKNPRVDQHLY